jgi:hypothetical protein
LRKPNQVFSAFSVCSFLVTLSSVGGYFLPHHAVYKAHLKNYADVRIWDGSNKGGISLFCPLQVCAQTLQLCGQSLQLWFYPIQISFAEVSTRTVRAVPYGVL